MSVVEPPISSLKSFVNKHIECMHSHVTRNASFILNLGENVNALYIDCKTPHSNLDRRQRFSIRQKQSLEDLLHYTDCLFCVNTNTRTRVNQVQQYNYTQKGIGRKFIDLYKSEKQINIYEKMKT